MKSHILSTSSEAVDIYFIGLKGIELEQNGELIVTLLAGVGNQ
jgi:hypothetical protein